MLHNSKTEVQNNQVTNAKYLKNKIFKLKEDKKKRNTGINTLQLKM